MKARKILVQDLHCKNKWLETFIENLNQASILDPTPTSEKMKRWWETDVRPLNGED